MAYARVCLNLSRTFVLTPPKVSVPCKALAISFDLFLALEGETKRKRGS